LPGGGKHTDEDLLHMNDVKTIVLDRSITAKYIAAICLNYLGFGMQAVCVPWALLQLAQRAKFGRKTAWNCPKTAEIGRWFQNGFDSA
jgi:hypothetical protein